MLALNLDFAPPLWRPRLARWAILPSLLAVSSCARPPTDQECLALLDRYAELLVRVNRPEATGEEIETIKASARTQALRQDPRFCDCRHKVTRRSLECALGASSLDEMERCLL